MPRHIFCTLLHTHIFARYAGGVRVTLRSTTGWHQHWKCAHKKRCTRPPCSCIHPSLHVWLLFCTSKRAGACKWRGILSHLSAVDSDCFVSIDPKRKIHKLILKEGWSCRVHKVKPNSSLASLTLENVVWLEVWPVVSQLLVDSQTPANILKLVFVSPGDEKSVGSLVSELVLCSRVIWPTF